MPILPPLGNAKLITQLTTEKQNLADCIQKQIDIGWIVHIGLYHKRVTTTFELDIVIFAEKSMAGFNNHLVDLIKDLRGEKRNIVLDGLQGIDLVKFENRMPQKLTNLFMVVGDIVQLVIVPIAVQA